MRAIRPREEVLSDLQDAILQQEPRFGDPIPAEDLLARSLGLSVFQVRDGVNALEALGVLDARPDGTRVIGGRGNSTRTDLLRLRMSLTDFPAGDLVDVRIQLETCTARRAALEASRTQLERLQGFARAMRDPGIGRARFNSLDDQFHTELAEASTNALAANLMHALRDAFAEARGTAFAATADWASTQHQLADEHHDILTAVGAGESEAAANQLHHHIADFYAATA